jgi:alpha-amylase
MSGAKAKTGRPSPPAASPSSQPAPSPPIPLPPPDHPHPAGSGHEVLFQAFHWDSVNQGRGRSWWATVAAAAPALKALGVTATWLPPPSASAAREGYLPTDLYCFDSAYGSESDLRSAVAALKAAGVTPVADAVLNHRCAAAADAAGRWNVFSPGGPGAGTDPARPSLAWGPEAIVAEQAGKFGAKGAKASGGGSLFGGAPNLDHSHEGVKTGLSSYARLLVTDLGFEGLRLDYAKGYSGAHAGDYLTAARPVLAVGEFWDALSYGGCDGGAPDRCQAAHAGRTAAWVAATGGTAGAFDMTTKGVLQAALERGEFGRLGVVGAAGVSYPPPATGGPLPCGAAASTILRPPGLLGLAPLHAFTFIDNHDTACQGHWPCPRGGLGAAHAYLLTHPGTPTLFWRHVFPDDRHAEGEGDSDESSPADRAALRGQVRALIAARSAAGVGAGSAISILYARDGPRPAGVGGGGSGGGNSAGSGGLPPPPRIFHPNDFINACGGDAAAASARAEAETKAAAAAWEAAAAAATKPPPKKEEPKKKEEAQATGDLLVGGYAAFIAPAPTAPAGSGGGLVLALGPAAAAAGGGGKTEWPGPGPGWSVLSSGAGWAVWGRE